MQGRDKVFSSAKTGGRDDWGTPRKCVKLFERVLGEFLLDAAAREDNAKCPAFLSDSLDIPWDLYGKDTTVWLNPPYSLNNKFMAKCVEEAVRCKHILAIVPARTDTKWWHNYVACNASYIWFVEGRMRFEGAEHGAPFPSALALFQGKYGVYEPRRIHRDYLCDYPYKRKVKKP